ncbi:glycosyltransferase family 39 protein [Kribbella sp. HUAS MG21]|jgi:hypothetical protein|uniref:Glycosyltransferase family 39 protein n=1 Tax=Kribbella sp. HUAS MG21 TaxID=3160966 RepID=A0AAU7TE10_9ACTN
MAVSEAVRQSTPVRRDTPRNRPLLILLGVLAVALTAVSGRYGYYHDEMYFVISGRHPAWGYPDQPPLTPLLARLADAVAPGQVWALRIPATVCTVLTVAFTALSVREMGGSRRAELLAAAAISCSSLVLITGHVLGTSTTDLCFTAALTWLLTRLIRTGNQRLWLVIGVVLGVGLLNKVMLALWAFAAVVALVLAGRRRLLHSRWFFGAGVVAVALWSPYLVWQAQHGWPQLGMASALRAKGSLGGAAGMLPYQIVIGPLLLPLCVVGLVWLWRGPFRVFALTYVVFALLLMATGGKATYLSGAYPAVFAGAGIAVDRWIRTRRRSLTVYGALGLSALIAAPLGLPLLPERAAVAAGSAMGIDQARSQLGWPEVADAAARALNQLSPDERSRAVVYADNYGQASAIEFYGPARGLPQVYSGHNGYALWGPPPDSADIAVVIDGDRRTGAEVPDWTRQACESLTRAATIETTVATRERGKPVWICDLREPWSVLWPRLTRLDG